MIFVNVYEYSLGTHGDYALYRIYSGESDDEIKNSIINHIIDSWDGAGDEVMDAFEELDSSLSFKEIARGINDILNELVVGSELHEYDLIIGDHTSDISDCLDFYGEYKDAEINGGYDGAGVYFYGGYAIKVQKLFPYFYNLIQDYGVGIDNKIFDKMVKDLI
jgi:hypothetical protein